MIFFFLVTTTTIFRRGFLITDRTSYAFLFLTAVIFSLRFPSVERLLHNNYSYKLLVILLYLIVLLFFISNTLLRFFILFEASLMPITLLILGWGYQRERIIATYYLLIYTLFFSIPLIVSILIIINRNSSQALINDYINIRVFIRWILLSPFLTKFPIYFLHLWLPKAHVEASIVGSILLAAILLKIGLYGVLRINSIFYNYHLTTIIVGVVGTICRVIICLFQSDLKRLIAYSRVLHITSIFLILEIALSLRIKTIIMIGVVHGFVSSSLFFYSGVLYASRSTRLMFFLQGTLLRRPIIRLYLAIRAITNFGVPPLISIYRELLTIITIVNWRRVILSIIIIITFLRCYYNLYLWNRISHGKHSYVKDKTIYIHFNLISFSFFWLIVFFILYSNLLLPT